MRISLFCISGGKKGNKHFGSKSQYKPLPNKYHTNNKIIQFIQNINSKSKKKETVQKQLK
jgi:hypothetical protein